MKIKRILLAIGCAAGAAMIGVFAGRLNEPVGVLLFTVGVLLVACLAIALGKE